jgi:hypothetical protein
MRRKELETGEVKGEPEKRWSGVMVGRFMALGVISRGGGARQLVAGEEEVRQSKEAM